MMKSVFRSAVCVVALFLLFSGNAGALERLLVTDSEVLQSRWTNPLYELAQNGGERKACHQESSLERCAACCRAAQDACVELVIPMCHQDEPSRAEFRHCTKDRERRCQTDFDNCAWLCRRVK